MLLSLSIPQEWCELSVNELVQANGLKEKDDRRKNFFYVASRASSHHLAYHRDLLLLLSLSMDIEENNLALDLGTSASCCRYTCNLSSLRRLFPHSPLHFFSWRDY